MESEIRNPSGKSNDFSGKICRSAEIIRKKLAKIPRVGLVLGSGFGSVAEALKGRTAISYSRLPGFPKPSVAGHAGRLLAGNLGARELLILEGRSHYYEGHSLEMVTLPVRMLAELGVQILILTNAAGGIDKKFKPGDFMLIKDHINFMGANPLRGPVPPGRERFVDLTEVYDKKLRRLMAKASEASGVPLREGVYLAVSGPSYETPAEIKAFAKLGADAVGMSTVPEAIVARQCGLRVLGISCITNPAAGLAKQKLSHREVLDAGRRASLHATELIQRFLEMMAQNG